MKKLGILMVFVFAFALVNIASADSITKNAGTGTNVSGIGEINWNNPDRIVVPGGQYAYTSNFKNTATKYLQGTNYTFNLPLKAVVNGITVKIRRESSAINTTKDNVVSLIKGGVVTGNNKATTTYWGDSFQEITYGGSSDLWGTTWTRAEINSSNFGVALSAINNNNNKSATVDYMQITVNYTIDNIAPTIDSVSDIMLNSTSASGAFVTITPPMSHDNIDGDLPAVCDHLSGTFPIGLTTVTCAKTDRAGNVATPVTFKVAVWDAQAPSGYSVYFTNDSINPLNQSNASFVIHNAEIGSYLYYWIYDGDVIAQQGDRNPSHEMRNYPQAVNITSSDQTVSGLDLSNYDLGQIVLVATLIDDSMNFGADVYDFATKISEEPKMFTEIIPEEKVEYTQTIFFGENEEVLNIEKQDTSSDVDVIEQEIEDNQALVIKEADSKDILNTESIISQTPTKDYETEIISVDKSLEKEDVLKLEIPEAQILDEKQAVNEETKLEEKSPEFRFTQELGPRSEDKEAVIKLQELLRDLGYFKYPTNTGVYGQDTYNAVVGFQADRWLEKAGKVGPMTIKALNQELEKLGR